MNRKIIFIGGGGHFLSVFDSFSKEDFDNIAIVDSKEKIGEKIMEVPIIGSDSDLEDLYKKGYHYAFITIGGNVYNRIKIYNILNKLGFKFPNIIDKTAVISSSAKLHQGIFVGKRTVVNAEASIKDFTIINTGAIVEHQVVLEEFSNISPGSIILGGAKVSKNSFIGGGSVIKQGIKIGSDSIIGMGSVVTKDIESGLIAYGNPCKGVRKNDLYNS